MKKTFIASSVLAASIFTGQAQAASTLIKGMDMEGAEIFAEEICAMVKGDIMDAGNSYTTCEYEMGMGQTVAYQMLLGNSYSTTPTAFVKITHRKSKKGVRLNINAWVELQMAFGQTKRTSVRTDGIEQMYSKLQKHYDNGGDSEGLYPMLTEWRTEIHEKQAKAKSEQQKAHKEKYALDI